GRLPPAAGRLPGRGESRTRLRPKLHGPASDLDGRLAFRREFFGGGCADLPADVIVCRHVIEHVARPLGLLRAVREALAQRPRARVFLETPSVEWILENRAVWDFFDEHCSLFSAGSLAALVRAAGFGVDAVRHVFGGQYLWLEASVTPAPPAPGWSGGQVAAQAMRYAEAEAREVARWVETVRARRAFGLGAGWGAGPKGSTFASLVDPSVHVAPIHVFTFNRSGCSPWAGTRIGGGRAHPGSAAPHPAMSGASLAAWAARSVPRP